MRTSATQEPEHCSATQCDVDALASCGDDAWERVFVAGMCLAMTLAATGYIWFYAVSIPFLKLCGFALGGWLLAKSAAIAERKLAAGASDRKFLEGKIASARFYAEHILPQSLALGRTVEAGAGSVVETDAELI